jgi:hypothetical protein
MSGFFYVMISQNVSDFRKNFQSALLKTKLPTTTTGKIYHSFSYSRSSIIKITLSCERLLWIKA